MPPARKNRRPCLWAAAILLLLPAAATADPPRCATPFLPRAARLHKPAVAQAAASPFKVGDPLTVNAVDFRTSTFDIVSYYKTTTTCRWVGTHCYIFVEDDIWGSPRVTQQGIEALARAFDEATPRFPDRGIFDISIGLFGPTPDADGDPRILIVVLDVIDSVLSGTFSGYYDTENQAAPVAREIVYIDSNPLDLDSDLARATLAHEFQHMLHWNADPDEDKWVDEGCSDYAELACGYKDTATAAEGFLQVPNVLKSPDPTVPISANFGITNPGSWAENSAFLPLLFDQAFLMLTYFAERYGDAGIARLVAEPENGSEGMNRTFRALGVSARFETFWASWAAAVLLDGEGAHGYRGLDLRPVRRDTVALPAQNLGGRLQLQGLDYYVLAGASDLSIDIQGTGNLLVALLAERNGEPVASAVSIPAGRRRRLGLYGTVPIALAVSRTSGGDAYTFSAGPRSGASPAAADFDASGLVDLSDFIAFASGFGKSAGQPAFDPSFDLDGNGSVAFADFVIFARNFGKFP